MSSKREHPIESFLHRLRCELLALADFVRPEFYGGEKYIFT
jgi:hypothetical protein